MFLFAVAHVLANLKVLRTFGHHDNILRLVDVMTNPPDTPNFEAIYLVTESFDCTLKDALQLNENLHERHVQYLLFQILRGLAYLHSAEISHANLSSQSLLVNSRCDLVLSDFGLAQQGKLISHNIVEDSTCPLRHRPPEVLCKNYDFSCAADVWSTGCIFAEMILNESIFKGDTTRECLTSICSTLGNPPQSEWENIGGKSVGEYIPIVIDASQGAGTCFKDGIIISVHVFISDFHTVLFAQLLFEN